MKETRRYLYLFLIMLLAFVTSLPIRATDDNVEKTQATIIVDFTGINKDASTLVYKFFGKDITEVVSELNRNEKNKVNALMILDNVKEGMSTDKINEANRAKETFLTELKNNYKEVPNKRWISRKKDTIAVYVFHMAKNAEIKIEEKERKTSLAQDVSVLKHLIVEYAAREGEAITVAEKRFTLEKKYGKLEVSVILDKDEKKAEQKEEKMEIITGPTEHWFLSADFTAAKLTKVKFITSQGAWEPRETPKAFYLGMNWMIGDILKERQNLLKNFFIKGMLKFSKNPLESYGIGIGYKFPKVRVLGIDISCFSAFAALLWSKEQSADQTKELKKRQVQAGFSFNLDKAMGWVK
ncbi:MAG: hypothetical protein ACM3SY_18490 [Candidatus Omnitrophota bacterium]